MLIALQYLREPGKLQYNRLGRSALVANYSITIRNSLLLVKVLLLTIEVYTTKGHLHSGNQDHPEH